LLIKKNKNIMIVNATSSAKLSDKHIAMLTNELEQKYNKKIENYSKRLLEIFLEYEWKGNVRELKHIVESLVSLSDDYILEVDSLPIYMRKNVLMNATEDKPENEWQQEKFISLSDATKKVEMELILNAMVYTRGNITKSAEMLDIPRQTLKYKLDKYIINEAIL